MPNHYAGMTPGESEFSHGRGLRPKGTEVRLPGSDPDESPTPLLPPSLGGRYKGTTPRVTETTGVGRNPQAEVSRTTPRQPGEAALRSRYNRR